MKPNHTPGPWQVANENEPWRIIGNVDGGYGDDGNGVVSEDVCEISESERMEGNRALILHAPQLLEACKRVVYEDDRKVGYDYLVHQTIMDAIKAAVAAAEGK